MAKYLESTIVGSRSAQRESQQHYYEEECSPEFEIRRPHGCGRIYEFLIDRKFRDGLEVLGLEISGMSILEVCCGSGMMSERFALAGGVVTGIDFSPAAITRARERARRYNFAARFLVADAERLAFPDRSFDIVAVHDGLHHLEHPETAIREMARVARRGILILDPARAALTKLAIWLGVAVEVEEAGNHVKRVVPQEVAATLRTEGYADVSWRRTLMYYPHQPFGWFRWIDNPLPFAIFRSIFWSTDFLLGRWGNKLALGARRAG
jgi:2-polyprenyl-3-methyl-5-hydroxy-6-metoxy-1,4-benzoquinol methylase